MTLKYKPVRKKHGLGAVRERAAFGIPTSKENVPTPEKVLNKQEGIDAVPKSTNLSPLRVSSGLDNSKSWTQDKIIGKMNAGDFASIAGGLGNALAPDTSMGRIGALAAGLAREEQQRVRDAPGKALDMRIRNLQIDNLKKQIDTPRSLTAFENFNKYRKQYEDFKSLDRTPRPLTAFENFKEYPETYKRFKSLDRTPRPLTAFENFNKYRKQYEDFKRLDRISAINRLAFDKSKYFTDFNQKQNTNRLDQFTKFYKLGLSTSGQPTLRQPDFLPGTQQISNGQGFGTINREWEAYNRRPPAALAIQKILDANPGKSFNELEIPASLLDAYRREQAAQKTPQQ